MMIIENQKKLLQLARETLRTAQLAENAGYFDYLGGLEAARLPLEELDTQISPSVLETIEALIDPETGSDEVDLETGISRVLGMIEVQISMLDMGASGQSKSLIPTFTASEAGATRIFELCSEMRKIIFASTDFDEPHKIRLLNRLAAIETETKKPEGLYDVVRGGINDLGETLGKFGKDVKPLTDRMKEVVSIARKGTKEYDQLPEPEEVKQLPAPEDNKEV
ncbi:hypothetical protein [Roseovarius atlanticus]|uniref:hypothetical protein n=1 Tax=Roseovarius atlanticus TaxID=1641875 RepID=UPI001C9516DF|nr:hypothetical protein [Roseovarius atlanticus]MBY5989065.1 hypothetical protein [Roseovarius atlanticus]MBY6124457.1 hypothetical protein [Roseovarius atlanticus]MBY6148952.1 hypothetical protein [Roseovarius atlanticus]